MLKGRSRQLPSLNKIPDRKTPPVGELSGVQEGYRFQQTMNPQEKCGGDSIHGRVMMVRRAAPERPKDRFFDAPNGPIKIQQQELCAPSESYAHIRMRVGLRLYRNRQVYESRFCKSIICGAPTYCVAPSPGSDFSDKNRVAMRARHSLYCSPELQYIVAARG